MDHQTRIIEESQLTMASMIHELIGHDHIQRMNVLPHTANRAH